MHRQCWSKSQKKTPKTACSQGNILCTFFNTNIGIHVYLPCDLTACILDKIYVYIQFYTLYSFIYRFYLITFQIIFFKLHVSSINYMHYIYTSGSISSPHFNETSFQYFQVISLCTDSQQVLMTQMYLYVDITLLQQPIAC